MSMGGGGSSKSTTTQTSNPWGPQQPYLTDIFARAQNLANSFGGSSQSPLYNQYIQGAISQAQSGIPGGDALYNAWGLALKATAPGTEYANAIANSSNDPGVLGRISDMIRSGYTPNSATPYANAVAQDIGNQTSEQYNKGRNLLSEIGSNTGVAQQLQNAVSGLNASRLYDVWGNQAIGDLANMAGSQWAEPYLSGLTAAGLSGTANPYMQQIAQTATGGNQYIPGVGNAAFGQMANPYTAGTADAASLAMSNPALLQLMETASGKYLTPDTNPYLQKAVQAAQEQTMASIASQFNQGGRYGSGMMAGTEAKQLGDIANQAYSNAYENERQRQEAARQALGGQYLQGVGQFTAGQQAAGGLQQQGLGAMLQGLTSQAGLQQGQQGLGLQGLGQAGQMYGTGIGQLLSGLQSGGALRGQQQQLGQEASAESGRQYGTAMGQDLAAQQLNAQISQNQIANTQNAYEQFLQAQNQRAQQALGTAGLLGNLSEGDLNRQLQAQQAGTQGYLQNIGLRTQGQQAAADTYLRSLGLQTNALGFAPQLQAMNQSNLGQIANAAQIQQQLMQQPQQDQWNNLANYLAMVQGSYGGTGTTRTPIYQNQAGSAMGGALGGAGLGMMVGGPYGAAIGGGLGLLGGMFG